MHNISYEGAGTASDSELIRVVLRGLASLRVALSEAVRDQDMKILHRWPAPSSARRDMHVGHRVAAVSNFADNPPPGLG